MLKFVGEFELLLMAQETVRIALENARIRAQVEQENRRAEEMLEFVGEFELLVMAQETVRKSVEKALHRAQAEHSNEGEHM